MKNLLFYSFFLISSLNWYIPLEVFQDNKSNYALVYQNEEKTNIQSNDSISAKSINKNKSLVKTLPNYWIKQDTLTVKMPYGIEIYRSVRDFSYNSGPIRKVNAYCVIVDPKYVEFKPTYSSTNKTPQNFIKDEPGTVLACVNAGFFGANISYSLLKYCGVTYSHNVASLDRIYEGKPVKYYVARAAFGLGPNLKPDVKWVYSMNRDIYSYNSPGLNDRNEAPKPKPTLGEGKIWEVKSAVGGSPMLIKSGKINVTDKEELIVIDNKSPRARTGIGYTSDGKIVILAVEGENKGVSDGLTLLELAHYMKDMGCVGAINLDGGSSTILRVNNQELIRPSSKGIERAMPGVILIKSRK